MSDKNETAEHLFFEGIKPASVEGSEAGSSYKLIARTSKGYIGLRRLSDDAYRIRVERFDKQPVLELTKINAQMLANLRMAFSGAGSRISGIVVGSHAVRRTSSFLLSILLSSDLKLEELPIQLDPKVVEVEAHVKGCAGCSKFYGLPVPEGTPEHGEATGESKTEHDGIQEVLAITDGKTN